MYYEPRTVILPSSLITDLACNLPACLPAAGETAAPRGRVLSEVTQEPRARAGTEFTSQGCTGLLPLMEAYYSARVVFATGH